MKIAVLGFGTVGKSILSYIKEDSRDIQIKYVLRRPGKATETFMTENYDEILQDGEIDVVVDALSGRVNSFELMKKALLSGKHVISANKSALCYGFSKLLDTASKNHVAIKYEASCGSTIPIISEIMSITNTNYVSKVYGIMNGSTNFIIDKMMKEDIDFKSAVGMAKTLGYTEADPTADISGEDAKNKLIILADTAFHGFVSSDFPVLGIEKLTKEILNYWALKQGKAIKLMGISVRNGNNYALGVVPCIVDMDLLEAHIPLNYNIFTVTGDMCGDLKFYGQGAGGKPTADAILRDIYNIRDSVMLDPMKHFFRSLNYEPDLLRGSAYIAEKRFSGSLMELFLIAKKKDEFMLFEWENLK